jgi:hypothetical protein
MLESQVYTAAEGRGAPAACPVWRLRPRLRLPVFIHTADPQEFWQPIDYRNERWLELALFPAPLPAEEFPAFEQLMTSATTCCAATRARPS